MLCYSKVMDDIPLNKICVSFRTEQEYKREEGDEGTDSFEKTGNPPPSLEQIVDADIAEFEEYFCTKLKNSSLTGPERSIIKTWLYWKTHPSGGGV